MEVVERTYAVVNPSTRRGPGGFPTLTDDELQEVSERADSTFRVWRGTPVDERAARFAELRTCTASVAKSSRR